MTYYVYTLSDPRDGKPFYVGKGKGARIHAHEKEALAGKESAKCDRIRAIWSEGRQVERALVSHHANEDDAYDAETRLMLEIGFDRLTNILLGQPFRIPGRTIKRQPKPPPPFWTPANLKRYKRELRFTVWLYATRQTIRWNNIDFGAIAISLLQQGIRTIGREALWQALREDGEAVSLYPGTS